MSFLDAALRNARRGFPGTPVRGKGGFLPDWPNTATTDEAQIRDLAAKYSDLTNWGVVFGGKYVGLDSDCVSRLMELAGHPEWFDTYTVTSGRENRRHWYFLSTPEVLAFGNRSFSESKDGDNIFEVKAAGALLVAEGSVHVDTGDTYQCTERPLIPFPAGLLQLLKSLIGAKADGPGVPVPGNDFKVQRLLGFLLHYDIAQKGEPTAVAVEGVLIPSSRATLSTRLSSVCSSTSSLEATALSAVSISILLLMIRPGTPVPFSRAAFSTLSSSICSSTSSSVAATSSFVAICLLDRDSRILEDFPMVFIILEPLVLFAFALSVSRELPDKQASTGPKGSYSSSLSRRISKGNLLTNLPVRKR